MPSREDTGICPHTFGIVKGKHLTQDQWDSALTLLNRLAPDSRIYTLHMSYDPWDGFVHVGFNWRWKPEERLNIKVKVGKIFTVARNHNFDPRFERRFTSIAGVIDYLDQASKQHWPLPKIQPPYEEPNPELFLNRVLPRAPIPVPKKRRGSEGVQVVDLAAYNDIELEAGPGADGAMVMKVPPPADQGLDSALILAARRLADSLALAP